jgi:3-isopropylmalate dehydrogenase
LKVSDGLFLKVCDEVAKQYPDVKVDDVLVDAMVALLVRDPARYDVILTTNMFGDILSDLTAELSGSLGLGGSINASATNAMAQASHGSAPDLAGKNVANPFSLIISSGMLFAWQGARTGDKRLVEAANAIDKAVAGAVADGDVTRDLAGSLNTDQAGTAVAKRILAA